MSEWLTMTDGDADGMGFAPGSMAGRWFIEALAQRTACQQAEAALAALREWAVEWKLRAGRIPSIYWDESGVEVRRGERGAWGVGVKRAWRGEERFHYTSSRHDRVCQAGYDAATRLFEAVFKKARAAAARVRGENSSEGGAA